MPASDTGGVNIGPIANVGDHVFGLKTATALASGAAVGGAELLRRRWMARRAGKDYNDAAISTTAGSDQGKPVDWVPPL